MENTEDEIKKLKTECEELRRLFVQLNSRVDAILVQQHEVNESLLRQFKVLARGTEDAH